MAAPDRDGNAGESRMAALLKRQFTTPKARRYRPTDAGMRKARGFERLTVNGRVPVTRSTKRRG